MPFTDFFSVINQINYDYTDYSMLMNDKLREKKILRSKQVSQHNINRYKTNDEYHARINESTLKHNNNKYATDPEYKSKKLEYYQKNKEKQAEYYKKRREVKRAEKAEAKKLLVV